MAQFRYTGRERSGKRRQGKVRAESKREAVIELRERNIAVIEIEQIQETLLTKEITVGRAVKLQDFVIYLRQFATLLKAGVTIVEATKILSEQTESKPLSKALVEVEAELRTGNALSQTLEKHPKIFPALVVNMVRAGEAGGKLDETLEQLADHYEKTHKTRQKIVSALAYPTVVGFIAIAVVIFLLVGVVPTFVGMFEDFGGELPAITTFVLAASDFMQGFWWLVVLMVVFVYGTIILLKRKKTSKYYLDYVILKLPIFGKMMQKAVIARMTRTLSSLFSSSVPILEAMAIVEKIVENEVVARVIHDSRDSLEKGRSLTDPMKAHWVFPPLVTQMIAIGEQTGSLDAMLGKVADFYETEVDTTTERLKSLIEPVMIVLLAAIVGTIVTSIIIPMFEIFNHVG